MKNAKRLIPILMCLVMVFSFSFGLAGCGKGGSGGGGGGQPASGGDMVIGTSIFVDTLNPLSAELQVSAEVIMLIYDPLVRFDKDLNPIPCLAKSWEISDDQLTWTFHLVDTKWQDGEPFTSKDVKWTYDAMLADDSLGYMYSSYLGGIKSVECPDDKTVVITTDQPKANMLQNQTPIMPEHIMSDIDSKELLTWTNDNPVGTGPFKFVKKTDTQVFLSKNADYFGTVPNLDTLTFMVYGNSDSLAQALKTGEIDAATSLEANQKKNLTGDKNLTVISGECPGFTQLGINVYDNKDSKGNPLLRDKAIRHAIEYAIDKQKAIDMFYDGAGSVGTTLINPGDKFHYEPTADELRSFDTAKSKQALADAGYKDTNGDGILEAKDGTKLNFKLICISDNSSEVKFGQMIKSNLKDVGIGIDLVTMDSGALTDKVAAYDYDMFIWGWGSDVDPTVILDILTEGQIASCNEPGWINKDYDDLVAKQQTVMDEAERIKLVQDAQKLVYADAPYIILVYDNYTQAYRSDRWTGFEQIPAGKGVYFFNFTDNSYINVAQKS